MSFVVGNLNMINLVIESYSEQSLFSPTASIFNFLMFIIFHSNKLSCEPFQVKKNNYINLNIPVTIFPLLVEKLD